MAIKTETRRTGILSGGSLPSVGFGSADVGSGLLRAGARLMAKSQQDQQQVQAMNDTLQGRQDAYARPVLNPDGTWTTTMSTDDIANRSPEYQASFRQNYIENRFTTFQEMMDQRLVQIQTDANLLPDEKIAAMADFGRTAMDKLGIHESERGRYGAWLTNRITARTSQVISANQQQMQKLLIDDTTARIKRSTDELVTAIQGGVDLEADKIKEQINRDFGILKDNLAIGENAAKIAQQEVFELARVTGMSRQIGTALSGLDVRPEAVTGLMNALQSGADYKLEWTDKAGRKWEIDTKKLDVVNPKNRDALISNIRSTVATVQQYWNDRSKNEEFMRAMQKQSSSVPIAGEYKDDFEKVMGGILEGGLQDVSQVQQIIAWAGHTGTLSTTVKDTVKRMLLSGDDKQMQIAGELWNQLMNVQDPRNGNLVGNSLANQAGDDAKLLDALSYAQKLGYTGEELKKIRDGMFSGDRTFAKTTTDAKLALTQTEIGQEEQGFRARAQKAWEEVGTKFLKTEGLAGSATNDRFGSLARGYESSREIMPEWFFRDLERSYSYNYAVNGRDPEGSFNDAVQRVTKLVDKSPIYLEGAARVTVDLGNPEGYQTFTDEEKGWMGPEAQVTMQRGDEYDWLNRFVQEEIGTWKIDGAPVYENFPRLMPEDENFMTEAPSLGKNLFLKQLPGNYENPQFEVWYENGNGERRALRSAVTGDALLIQPAAEKRYLDAKKVHADKQAELKAAQEKAKSGVWSETTGAFIDGLTDELQKHTLRQLPGEEIFKRLDEKSQAKIEYDSATIDEGYEKAKQELELTAPRKSEPSPHAGSDPVVDAVRAVVAPDQVPPASGETMTTPYDSSGQPTRLEKGALKFDSGITPEGTKPEVLAAAEQASALFGQPLNIRSAYRDPKRNAKSGGAKGSRHMHGDALDISLNGLNDNQRTELVRALRAAGFKRIGAYSGNTGLHVDMRDMGTGKVHPMFDKSIQNMHKAPKWFTEGLKGDVGRVATAKAEPEGRTMQGKHFLQLTQPQANGRDVVRTAATAIDKILPDGTGGAFLVNMAATESQHGTAPGTFRLSGDRGIWQINRGGAYAEVLRQAGLKDSPVAKAADMLKQAYGLDVRSAQFSDMDKPLMNAAFARLYIIARLGERQIPKDTGAQAAIWKREYNTHLGAGTINDFLKKAEM